MVASDEFRLKAKQLYDSAFDYMLEEHAYLLFVINNFRDAANAIALNIPQDEWTSEDYQLVMRANLLIMNNILLSPAQKQFSAKEETDHMMQMYHTADHSKLTLDYYLAAYEASVNFAGKSAHDALRKHNQSLPMSVYADYVKQAEEIARRVWDKIDVSQQLASDQLRQLAHADLNLAYINHACGQLDQALANAQQVIHSFASTRDFDYFDLQKITDVYDDLAHMFAFDAAYSQLFNFARDLFRGEPQANFLKFEEMVYALSRQPDEAYQRSQLLMQMMKLWNGKHELMLDESVFAKEMNDVYCQQQFNSVMERVQAVEDSHLQEMFAPLENTQQELSDVLRRADRVLEMQFPTIEELMAESKLDIPLLDEVALPSPGLLAKHSVFKVEKDAVQPPKSGLGREIPIKFGPQI